MSRTKKISHQGDEENRILVSERENPYNFFRTDRRSADIFMNSVKFNELIPSHGASFVIMS